MGWSPKDGEAIKLNCAFHVRSNIMRFVVASAKTNWKHFSTIAKQGLCFKTSSTTWATCNLKKWYIETRQQLWALQTILLDDSAHFSGLATRLHEIYATLVGTQVKNLADYQSKHHPGATTLRPWYLHMENLPLVLPQALAPSNLEGCVVTLKGGYLRTKVPLKRAPQIQIPEHVTASAVTCDTHVTCCSQVPRVPTWSDSLAWSLLAFGRTRILPSWLM